MSSSFPSSLELSRVGVWRFGFTSVAVSTHFLVSSTAPGPVDLVSEVNGKAWKGHCSQIFGGADTGAASVDGDKAGGRRPLAGVWTRRTGRSVHLQAPALAFTAALGCCRPELLNVGSIDQGRWSLRIPLSNSGVECFVF